MLTKTVPTSKTTAKHIAYLFMDRWRIPYGTPAHLLTNKDTLFVSKFVATACAQLEDKHLTTTVYHPQTNGRAKQFNKNVITFLRRYVAELQKDWNTLFQPLTYAYSTRVHCSTNQTSFRLGLSRHLPGLALLKSDDALPTDG